MRLEPFVRAVGGSHQRGQPATSAARIAARRRVVALAQVVHPALGYLTRHYIDNRRSATSSPAGWCTLLNGRHKPGTIISRPSEPPRRHCERQVWGTLTRSCRLD
jgi:hypothetical protein